jgi:hypothetical protein
VRTTIDIPNSLYRQLKGKAASEGRSVRELVLRAVQLALHAPQKKITPRKAPIIRSKHPGTLILDNDKIFEIIPFP